MMTYEEAIRLRTLAEMSRDPALYRRAAAAFAALGMLASADALYKRADWYEKGQMEVTK